ncbi:hypothetical protein [Pseudonocardia sp.]|uniref:hypothetical protein n=1 Tax=Pseudonocardia sp. TaxID=60912 RepID=UPI002631F5EB|nr:hypothetical protein [Pseudonocardia sp.]
MERSHRARPARVAATCEVLRAALVNAGLPTKPAELAADFSHLTELGDRGGGAVDRRTQTTRLDPPARHPSIIRHRDTPARAAHSDPPPRRRGRGFARIATPAGALW